MLFPPLMATLPPRLRALRTIFRTVGPVAPGLAARWAETIFCTPPRHHPRPADDEFLATGMRSVIPWSGGDLAVWHWGPPGRPAIVLSHGWGSRAGRLSALAGALAGAGFRVLAYDGPAHGASSGRFASLPEFARALRTVGEAVGPLYGLVGHSLGGAAVAMALHDGLRAERVVLIAPPADVRVFSDIFAETFSLPRAVQDLMHRNLRARLRIDWDDLHIPSLVAALRSAALVIHDRGDPDVPFEHGERIVRAWAGSRLVATTGLGHRAILQDPAVVGEVVGFMQEGGAG